MCGSQFYLSASRRLKTLSLVPEAIQTQVPRLSRPGKGWQSSWAPSLDRLSTSFTSLAQGLALFSSSSAMHKKYADYFIPHVSRCFIVFPQNYQIFHLAIKECPSHFFFLVLVFSLNFSWAALFCQWNQRSGVHWAQSPRTYRRCSVETSRMREKQPEFPGRAGEWPWKRCCLCFRDIWGP